MNDQSDLPNPEDENEIRKARRAKMQKIVEMGIDPWGARFDDRSLISDIRNQQAEIRYTLEEGTTLELPSLQTQAERDDFKKWVHAGGIHSNPG